MVASALTKLAISPAIANLDTLAKNVGQTLTSAHRTPVKIEQHALMV